MHKLFNLKKDQWYLTMFTHPVVFFTCFFVQDCGELPFSTAHQSITGTHKENMRQTLTQT